MNILGSLLQDIEIRYYWAMSRMAQSQRKSSSRIVNLSSDLLENSLLEENNAHLPNLQIEKQEYEKSQEAIA